jgi:hypothetical protein
MSRHLLGFILMLFCVSCFYGQSDTSEVKISMFSANLGYGIDYPGGDLSKRFGQSLSFITGMEYLINGKDGIGIDYIFNFGNKVKEDIFLGFRNENGYVIGIDGSPSILFLRQRGNYLGLNYSRIFKPSNKTSGLKLSLGAGILTHSIRVVDDSRNLILAENPYLKGLDRFTKGLAFKQELVYQHHSKNKAFHFNIGFNIMEGFTKQLRKVNFDTGERVVANRLDILYGIRVTWMIPLSKSIAGVVNYY